MIEHTPGGLHPDLTESRKWVEAFLGRPGARRVEGDHSHSVRPLAGQKTYVIEEWHVDTVMLMNELTVHFESNSGMCMVRGTRLCRNERAARQDTQLMTS